MRTVISSLLLIVLAGSSSANGPSNQFNLSFLEAAKYTFVLAQNDPALSIPSEQLAAPKSALEPKNRGKAMFLSLLLPGLGQRYAQAKTKGAVFLGVEIGLWLTYGGLTVYGDWRQNDYETYAATHAGVNLDGKNNTYFIDVGNFDNIYEHNDYRLQQRNFDKYYQDIDFWYWDWENQAHRDTFDELRISADTADNRATFVLGAIVANHIISAIDAVWTVHKYEKNRLSKIDWDVQFGDGYVRPTVNLNLTAHF